MYKEEFNFTEPPKKNFLYPYVLLVLHKLGGEARKREVEEELIDWLDLSDEILEKKFEKGSPVFSNRLAFSRLELTWAGYVGKPGHGIWKLTETGREKVKELEESDEKETLENFRRETVKRIVEEGKRRKSKKVADSSDAEDAGEHDETLEEETVEESRLQKDLEKIKNLDPYAFERLCAKLLKAAGYEDVEVTKKSRDEGIDGIGYLVFGLVRFKVVFQAKRFTEAKISSKDIDALGGTMRKTGSEKAIFITTSAFTRDARKTALEYGIELINGEKLMELLFKYEIGYSKNLDEEFLKNI